MLHYNAVLPTFFILSSAFLVTATSSMQLKSTHATNTPTLLATMRKKFQLKDVLVYFLGLHTQLEICCYAGYISHF